MRKKNYFSPFLLLSLILLAACETVPITGRRQLDLVQESSLVAMSTQQYQQFLASEKIERNTEESERVKRVGQRLANAVEQFFASRGEVEELRDYNWEFTLVDDPTVNAWAMPGGKVAVYEGILDVAETEAGLAAIMAHEIAHVIAQHGSERLSQGLLAQMGGMALSTALSSQPQQTQQLWMQAFGIGAQYGVLLPYSRLQETEADRLGLIFMALAGYDPQAAVNVWQKMMERQGGGAVPEFLSTHPTDQTRLRNIRRNIPEAMEYYRPG